MTLRDLLMLCLGAWIWTIARVLYYGWRVRRLDKPIYVYGETVLPMPNDLRWSGPVSRLRLGTVEVVDGNSLFLDGRSVPRNEITDRYCEAVAQTVRQRALSRLIEKVDVSALGEHELERLAEEANKHTARRVGGGRE